MAPCWKSPGGMQSRNRVSDVLELVGESIRKHRLFRANHAILVAVSGGLDSMVLLDILQRLSAVYAWKLAVAHFNHRLRGRSSNADETLVRKTAERWRLPFELGTGDVRGFARQEGLSLEMAARKLRHEFLAHAAVQAGAKTIALAHHLDDQIELFFLRLLRGSGPDGLSGMKWRTGSPANALVELVRPLLNQSRASLASYADSQKISYREDASNACLDVVRNRIRHRLLPLIRREYQPAIDRIVPRTMNILGFEAEFTTHFAREWLQGPRDVPFNRLSVAIQRRCLQLQLTARKITPEFEFIEQLRLEPGRSICVPSLRTSAPVAVWRDSEGNLHLQAPKLQLAGAESLRCHLEGRAGEIKFATLEIRWALADQEGLAKLPRRAGAHECFDAEKVGKTIVLRHWYPGDRFQPIGMPKPVKLQDLFTNQKVPRDRRHSVVIAATEPGEIFWVEGMRISERFKLLSSTIRRLHWRWQTR